MENVLQKNGITELCSGCGICSVVCPAGYLKIEENLCGELRPIQNIASKCVECGMCNKVCPFSAGVFEVAEKKNAKCFIGWVDEYRADAASGGCCTWFLNQLLQSQIVDAVVSVRAYDDSDNLFNYTVCHSEVELKNCFGAAYYPVTLSEVLSRIEKENGTVAIVGVPCFVSAVRNLQNISIKWKKKISVVVGLTCGHTPTKRMVDVLAWTSGKTRNDIETCRFRIKDESRPAWDYGVKLQFKDGQEICSYGSDTFGFLFWRRLFSQKCCNYCSDVFAEQADITFMDAWLPEYKEQNQGTSMIINRDSKLQPLLEKINAVGIITELPMEKAKEAQQKLCDFKADAGKHHEEEKMRKKIASRCIEHPESKSIIDELKRIIYKEQIRRSNKLLWMLMESKDRIFKR